MPKTLPIVDISAPVCCAPVAAGPLDDDAALEIALRLKALADPMRVKLVSLLFGSTDGEVCSCDLATAVGLTESTVSHHSMQLRR
jgi:DNA-binding transcriptional ArsR family regulator